MRWCVAPQMKWFSALLILGVLGVVAAPARAQIPGDVNGDGTVNAADLAGLAACMGGPGSTATPECGAVFPGGPVPWIGLMQATRQQAAAARNAGCLDWASGAANRRFPRPSGVNRGYCLINEFFNFNIYGVEARIDSTHQPSLCLQPTANAVAFSLRWVTVAGQNILGGSSRPIWWVQGGVATSRSWGSPLPPRITTVLTRVYTELWDLNGAWRVRFFGVPPSPSVYTVQWYPFGFGSVARWMVEGAPVDSVLNASLPGFSGGDRAQWAGETLNVGDRMAGSVANPCRFRDCQWELGTPGNFIPLEFFPDEFLVTPRYLYGAELRGSDGFDIWDWWP